MKKISILTYTHSNCEDVLDGYLGRLTEYAGMYQSLVTTNAKPKKDNVNHHILVYDEKCTFSDQMLQAAYFLKGYGVEYFVYSQEDFILYDYVDVEEVEKATEFITSGKTDFVKLIKSGGREYCMQAAVHSVDKFIKFYKKYQIDSIRQEGFLSQCSIGEYESKIQPESWIGDKRGAFHYDSKVWPYIATALNKGKWNLSEYKKELMEFKQEYMVEFDVRGTV
jgi:hypothetical protein